MEPSENMNAWNISVFDLLTKLLTHRVNGRTLKVNKAQDQPTGRGGVPREVDINRAATKLRK